MEKVGSLCKLVGCKYPVIQSPMAGVSTIKMAAAVTNGGGIGSIPFGGMDLCNDLDKMKDQLDEFTRLTSSNIVNLNFFCHDHTKQYVPSKAEINDWHELFRFLDPNIEQDIKELANGNVSFNEIEEKNASVLMKILELISQYTPKVISFHFGIPSKKTIEILQKQGSLIFASVTSVAEAEYVLEAGVNGLICQGYEAGGHRGNFLSSALLDENLSTLALFESIIPMAKKYHAYIVPAGGITKGNFAKYLLHNGASAVQIGSAFLCAEESSSRAFMKEQLESGDRIPTIMTSLVSGREARCLRTPFIQSLIERHDKLDLNSQPSYGYAYFGYKRLKSILNDPKWGFYLAGQNYSQMSTNKTTAQILDEFISELRL